MMPGVTLKLMCFHTAIEKSGQSERKRETDRERGVCQGGQVQQFHFNMQMSVFSLLSLLFVIWLYNGLNVSFCALTMQMRVFGVESNAVGGDHHDGHINTSALLVMSDHNSSLHC